MKPQIGVGSSVAHIAGLFEAHLDVRNLDASVDFYTRVVGLQFAHAVPERAAAFFWIGGAGHTMLGLWGTGSGPQQTTLHVAFHAPLADVIASPRLLRIAGVTPLDFDGRATDEPIVIAWMPAASVFFRDPDGHLLELIAMLPDAPRPDLGIVPWHEWQDRVSRTSRAESRSE
jgi:lactoylglutathione lyase